MFAHVAAHVHIHITFFNTLVDAWSIRFGGRKRGELGRNYGRSSHQTRQTTGKIGWRIGGLQAWFNRGIQ